MGGGICKRTPSFVTMSFKKGGGLIFKSGPIFIIVHNLRVIRSEFDWLNDKLRVKIGWVTVGVNPGFVGRSHLSEL